MAAVLRMSRALSVACLLLTLPVTAQVPQDGDCVVVGHTYGPVAIGVSWHSHDGKQSGSLFSSSAHSGGAGLTAAPLNDGVLFTCVYNPGARNPLLFHVDKFAQVNTIGTLSSPIAATPIILVDQGGDLLLLNAVNSGVTGGLYRMPMVGGGLRTIAVGIPNAVAMEEELVTGNFLVADVNGNVHHVTRGGTTVSITKGAFPGFVSSVRSKMHDHFPDGSVITTWANYVLRYDPGSGAVATLVSGGSVTHIGLDHDPIHGGYYRGDSNALVRYDPVTAKTTTLHLYQGGLFTVSDVATWGSRMLTGQTPPRPGTPYQIHLGLFSESGRAYLAAASLGTLLGIPTPAGRIPLDPDPLFFLSLANPLVFQGFAGFLSRSGTARLTIHLPGVPALTGVRFYVAAITYDASGIRRISEPLGVIVE